MFARIDKSITFTKFSLYAIGLMAYLPFITAYHRLPIPSFHTEWIAALLGVVALISLLKRESWQPLEIPHIALVFAGFMAIVLMQAMLGMLQSTQYAVLVASYLMWAFLLTVLGGHLRRQFGWEKLITVIAWGILAGGITNIVFVLMQYLHRYGVALPFMPNFSGYGAIGQLNHFGNYIALGLVSLIYLAFKKKLSVPIAVIVSALFLVLFAFSGSRSTWLYLSAFVVLAGLFRWVSLKQASTTSAQQVLQSKRLLQLALLLLPLFLVVQWLVATFTNGLVALPNERLMSELSGTTAVGGIAMRLHIWYESLLLFMQSPWLGIGVGQTRWMSFMNLDAHWSVNMPGSYENAHNIFIQLMAEMGVAGALLLLAGMFAWLRGFQWKNINLEGWWLLSVLSVIGIHSMLEYPLWYAYFLGLTAFLLGAGDEKRKQIHFAMAGQAVGRAAMTMLLLVSSVMLIQAYMANFKLEKWVTRGITGEINISNESEMLMDVKWVAEKTLYAPYAHLILATVITPDKKNLEDKIWLGNSALRFVPMRATAYRHVLLLEFNGQHDEAVQYLRRAIQAYPRDFKKELSNIPQKYWDLYLSLFSEAIAQKNGVKK